MIRVPNRAGLLACLAVLLLLAATGAATAATATIEPAGAIRVTSEGRMTFQLASLAFRCNLTLTGSLSRGPIELARGRTFGEIEEVETLCENGSISAFLNLPWPITVASIAGTIPSAITGILVTLPGFSWNLSVFGAFVNCLYEGPQGMLLRVGAVAGSREPWRYATERISLLATRLPLIRGGFGCASEDMNTGTLNLTSQTISVR